MAWFFIYIGGMISTWLGPWWTIVIVAIVAGFLFPSSGRSAFWQGVIGVSLLWGISTITIYLKNDGILMDRVAPIFFMPQGWMLIPVTILIGAVLGGLACYAGWKLRRSLWSPSSSTS